MKIKIFIVEDHAAMQNAYRLLLSNDPHLEIVKMVKTAEEALAEIPGLELDIVVVDLSLPGMSGMELIERLRKEHPNLPTLVISGHVERHYVESALAAGTHGYIDKKDAAVDIPRGIREVLDGKRFLSERVREKFSED